MSWLLDWPFEAALAEAQTAGKLLLVAARGALPAEAVPEAVLAIRVDPEAEPALAKQLQLDNWPTAIELEERRELARKLVWQESGPEAADRHAREVFAAKRDLLAPPLDRLPDESIFDWILLDDVLGEGGATLDAVAAEARRRDPSAEMVTAVG